VYPANAVPTIPLAVSALEITGAGGFEIVIVTVPVPVPPAFVAEIFTVVAAAVVGVPLITPVDALKVKPAGSGVAV